MVYPRRDASRSLKAFAAICAVNLCLLQSGAAAKLHKVAPSVSGVCGQTVSTGDAAVGIRIVTDASCAGGGVGCIDSVCRFCKVAEFPQSAHLIECGKIGQVATIAPAPTATTAAPVATTAAPVATTAAPVATSAAPVATSAAPVATTAPPPITVGPGGTNPCSVTQGDYDVGVNGIFDASCVGGGLGCFNEHCRHCKWKTTAQSSHLNDCNLYVATTAAPIATPAALVVTTAAPVATTAAPVATTAAPVATSASPIATTSAPTSIPAATTTSPPVIDTGCPYDVSPGNAAVGIQLVGDLTCAAGGTGCYMDVCRYCKASETNQSKHLISCKDLGYSFDVFNPADIDDETNAPQTSTSAPTSATPVATTAAPAVTTATPPVTTSAPVITIAPVVTTGCPFAVSGGDYAVGIQLVGDSSCAAGGVGCYEDICRYCQWKKTDQSAHLKLCSDLGYSFGASTPAPSSAAPVATTAAPVATTTAPVATTAAPIATSKAPTPTNTCPFKVSPGDYAVGIELVGDATCAGGGLGCFQDVCRYCKFRDSPQSKHLLRCADLGYTAPEPTTTPAPTPVPDPIPETGCPYPVADGDLAVGIQLVGDETCEIGGLGCYEGLCRYCKFSETNQSKHLIDCDDLGYSFTNEPTFAPVDIGSGSGSEGSDATDAPMPTSAAPVPTTAAPVPTTAAPVPTTAAPVPTTAAPVPTTAAPVPTTAAPVPTTAAPVPTNAPSKTGCSFAVSDGDYAVGIQLVGDKTCTSGGLGCFADVCRFCKYKKTAQSSHLISCKSLGYDFGGDADVDAPTAAPTPIPPPIAETGCPYPVSDGDRSVGIQLVGDATCASGGLGCYENICRYCKVHDTPQSKHFIDCIDLGYTFVDPTFKPVDNGSDVDETPAPTVAPTAAPTASPAPTATLAPVCPFTASEGDQAVGIKVVSDLTCKDGGVGCFQDVCRYCRVAKTDKSAHLNPCSDYGYTPAPVTAPPAPTNAPSNSPVTATPSAAQCSFTVSDGDQKVGISVVADAACASGGVGCIDMSTCRLCKVAESSQSSHLFWCKDVAGASPVTTSAPAPTTQAPATQLPPVSGICTETVSQGDIDVGINVVSDASCLVGGLGCVDKTVCRHCKTKDTAQSSHLAWCDKLTGATPVATTVAPSTPLSTAPAPATTTQTPVLSGACTEHASDGDKAVGIDIVTDRSCASGGVGCVDNSMCRHCKTVETVQSGHLVWCSSITGATPVATTAAPVVTAAPSGQTTAPVVTAAPATTTAAPTVCSQKASEGNLAAGINIETATSCVNGGVGCIDNTVCRYCKLKETTDSSHLEWCSTGVVLEPGLPVPTTTLPPIIVTGVPAPEPTHDPLTCSTEVAIGDEKGGVAAIHDETCLQGGVGCFGGVCRFCQVFPSDKSKDFLPCPKSVGLRLAMKSKSKVEKAESNSVKSKSVSLVSGKANLDDLFENRAFKVSITAAACVGLVAVVALAALSTKRMMARRAIPQTEEVETTEASATVVESEAATTVEGQV